MSVFSVCASILDLFFSLHSSMKLAAISLAVVALALTAEAQKKKDPVLQRLNNGESPKLSDAMNAVLTMVVIFFIVEVGNYVFTVKSEYERVKSAMTGGATKDGPEEEAMTSEGKKNVAQQAKEEIEKRMKQIQSMINLAGGVTKQIPMICILIVFARLRAKVDLEGTEPQPFAKQSFTAVSVLVVVQACALALSGCGETCNTVNIVIQGICKLGIIVCVCVIISSIFSLTKNYQPGAF